MNTIPTCTCGTAPLMAKIDEDQMLMQFLMGLNSCYDTTRGNILMMKPLPTINQAYFFVVQDEKQREIHSICQFQTESASMNVSYANHNDNKNSQVCSHRKKSGHHVSKCYRIIGFPKDFKFTKPKRGTANNVEVESDLPFSASPQENNVASSITVNQYNELMQLLQQHNLGKSAASSLLLPSTLPILQVLWPVILLPFIPNGLLTQVQAITCEMIQIFSLHFIQFQNLFLLLFLMVMLYRL